MMGPVDLCRLMVKRSMDMKSRPGGQDFPLHQGLMICQVLRASGIEVERHRCIFHSGEGYIQNSLYIPAFVVEGVLVGFACESSWEEIEQTHGESEVFQWPPITRQFEVASEQDDQEKLQKMKPILRDEVIQWINTETAFLQSVILAQQTHVLTKSSSAPRL